jgi:hypothetical protein
MPTRKRSPIGFLLAGFLFALTAILAYSSTSPRTEEMASPEAAPVASAGQVVTLDPETGPEGAHLPTELQQALGEALSRSSEGLVHYRHPSGAVGVNTGGRFRTATVATIGEDGEPVVTCVSSADGAHALTCDHGSHASGEGRR